MQILNFPPLEITMRQHNNRHEIYDPVRKRYFVLTPEEWVRQHVIAYLLLEKQVPINLIAVEKTLKINNLTKRFDVVVFNRNARPLMLIECKAPGIRVSESVFDQAARYNMSLKAGLFLITNGIEHYCCRIDFENSLYVFMNEIPLFQEMVAINAG
ncbi:MAG TPA: type I restriction enzyme HsdR N-terminal domain-containing protein [Bacteroidales bacterium]|jgi:type I site-specific restriction endonuclease|nr:type I restriction enzyme HsdR N-terminal domain-containing protein [Bacteroidales bacterium]